MANMKASMSTVDLVNISTEEPTGRVALTAAPTIETPAAETPNAADKQGRDSRALQLLASSNTLPTTSK